MIACTLPPTINNLMFEREVQKAMFQLPLLEREIRGSFRHLEPKGGTFQSTACVGVCERVACSVAPPWVFSHMHSLVTINLTVVSCFFFNQDGID